MRRWLLIGGALAVVLVVVVAILLYSSLDAVAKAAIEKIGSDVTGTQVRVHDVDISPTSGEGVLRGFRVTNPDGFEQDDVFQFEEITMKIDLSTLASDPIVIREVVVQRPRIRYEFGGKGTNVGTIQKNVESYADQVDPAAGRGFIIEHLYFRDGKINVAGAKLLKQGITTPLPDLHLTAIGTEEGGATPAVVANRIMDALGDKIATAVGSLDLDTLGREAVEDTRDAVKRAGKKLKGLFKKDD